MRDDDKTEITDDVIDESTDEIIPYRYSITSYGADYAVDMLIDRLSKDIIFIPSFQRSYVWTLSDASRFIESLLLGLPVPGIFLSKEAETGKLLVIDGHQRLKSLKFFYDGIFKGREFRLDGVQDRFKGKTYKTLENEDRLRLDDSIIHATIVKQDEPSDDESSIYHIFERLNTGGRQLLAQEIRACIYQGPFNNLLNELSRQKNWQEIYGPPSDRLKDQELILRFFALYFNLEQYKRPIKLFLNDFMGKNRKLNLYDKDALSSVLNPTVDLISKTLGRKAFRPERAVNAAVFDSIMIGITRRLSEGQVNQIDEFQKKYNELLQDEKYINSWKTATSDETNVKDRIRISTEYFSDLK